MGELDDILYGGNENKAVGGANKQTADPNVYSQAERVLAKFGGPNRLSRILKSLGRPRNASVLFRWTYPLDKGGTGGYVPSSAWQDIFEAAKAEGVVLSAFDLDPRPRLMSEGEIAAFPKVIRKRGSQPW